MSSGGVDSRGHVSYQFGLDAHADFAEVVGVTPSRQRLFIDSNNGVLSSNSFEHLIRYLDGEVARTVSS
jgi:hypothetical protein